MPINTSYLLDADLLLLAAWSAVVIIFAFVAFGRDLLPATSFEPSREVSTSEPAPVRGSTQRV